MPTLLSVFFSAFFREYKSLPDSVIPSYRNQAGYIGICSYQIINVFLRKPYSFIIWNVKTPPIGKKKRQIFHGCVVAFILQPGRVGKMSIVHTKLFRFPIHLFHEFLLWAWDVVRKSDAALSAAWQQSAIQKVNGWGMVQSGSFSAFVLFIVTLKRTESAASLSCVSVKTYLCDR